MKPKQPKNPPSPNVRFPDPSSADPETGLVAVGGDFSVARLTQAYAQGIFPWPMAIADLSAERAPPLWFSPDPRALLFFDELHIPRSFLRAQKKSNLKFTLDQAFSRVIQACAEAPRPGQDGTWITSRMLDAYIELHEAGHAHSFEAWEGDQLVAGLYGVDAGGAFAAESMFHLRDNASKLVVLSAVEYLRDRGAGWLDIQVLTPHMEKLGAREVERDAYLELLMGARGSGLRLF